MKRLVAAFFFSLGLHAFFFFGLGPPAKPKPVFRPPGPFTLTLSYRPPPASIPKTPEKPILPPAKPEPAVPRRDKPTPPRPAKPAQLQPVKPDQPRLPKPPALSDPTPQITEKPPERARPPEPDRMPEHLKSGPEKPAWESAQSLPVKTDATPPTPASDKPFHEPETALPPKPMELREARPTYRENPPPPYPESARRRRIEGTVLLEVFVDARGRADQVKIFESSGHRVLDRQALSAVRAWVFEPGRIGERPVGMWVKIPIRFVLK